MEGNDEQMSCPQLRVTVHLVLLNKHDSKLFNYAWGCNICKAFIFLQILIYCLRKTELRFKSYELIDFQHFSEITKILTWGPTRQTFINYKNI